jgi:hypothetical protein
MDMNTVLTFGFPLIVMLAMIFFILRPGRKVRTLNCTRCDGTGIVDERWPDPSKPGGWHELHGTCPKCGGVGKV